MSQSFAIIPSKLDDDDQNDTISLTKSLKKQTKKNKKKSSSKKQSYVMINTSFEDGDYDIDEEDEEYTDDTNSNINNIKHTNGSIMTSHQIAEESSNSNDDDDESTISELEEVELCSPNNNKRNKNNINNINNMNNINIKRGIIINKSDKPKYGLSAYYGVRLNYKDTKCHDIGWCIVWILHCIALLIVLVIVWSSEHVNMPHASNGLFILLFLLAFACIFAFTWTFLLKYCGGYICWVLIIGNLIFICAFAAFCFIVGDTFTGIGVIFTILFVLFAIFTLLMRSKINYTIALLQLGSSILMTTSSALMVAFGVLLVQIFSLFIWGSVVVAWTAKFYHTNSSSDFTGILLILIISYIWNHQVIKNIGHTTISALIAHWYFSPNSPYPTCHALMRCCTTSLGSIVFGSLFVNILQALRAYIRVLKEYGYCCQCGNYTLDCCLQGFDGLLEYFNTYAFVHVAVYNTAYMKAGKNTYDLLSMSKIYELIESNFTEYALLCGSICGGTINGILASWCANTMKFETDWVALFTCFGFMIGMALSASLLNAVSSCVVALFVLFAEEPKVLIEMHPEQHLRFDGAKKGIA
eukprot:401421_1